MTFQEITLDKGQPTPAGDLAMELAFEKLTGGCWHRFPINSTFDHLICRGECGTKTKNSVERQALVNGNPPLLTSLDAWRPLWEGMSWSSHILHANALGKVMDNNPFIWKAQPHHHLLASLRTLEDTCDKCEGRGWHEVCLDGITPEQEYCTCNNGKVSLMTIWEARI